MQKYVFLKCHFIIIKILEHVNKLCHLGNVILGNQKVHPYHVLCMCYHVQVTLLYSGTRGSQHHILVKRTYFVPRTCNLLYIWKYWAYLPASCFPLIVMFSSFSLPSYQIWCGSIITILITLFYTFLRVSLSPTV